MTPTPELQRLIDDVERVLAESPVALPSETPCLEISARALRLLVAAAKDNASAIASTRQATERAAKIADDVAAKWRDEASEKQRRKDGDAACKASYFSHAASDVADAIRDVKECLTTDAIRDVTAPPTKGT